MPEPRDNPIIDRNIWDAYGRWNEFAQLDSVDALKRAISGASAWIPNFAPPAISYIFEYAQEESRGAGRAGPPTVVDFGCGLGRNAPLLQRHFPRVVGLDLPEMVARLKGEFAPIMGDAYAAIYDSASELAAAEDYCVVYDSVALQHIVDAEYLGSLIDALVARESFRTLVSVYFHSGTVPLHMLMLQMRGWTIWHSEADALSFAGVPHCVTAVRRP